MKVQEEIDLLELVMLITLYVFCNRLDYRLEFYYDFTVHLASKKLRLA